MAGLERTIQINIHLGNQGVLPTKSVEPVKQETEKDKLLLRLANKDSLNDEDLMKLTGDVLNFVERKLNEGDVACVRDFLSAENRPMLTVEMKELISEKLRMHKSLK